VENATVKRMNITTSEIMNIDSFVKSQKTPSPLMGEGRGEGENTAISTSYAPSPLSPPTRGGEIRFFYKCIKC